MEPLIGPIIEIVKFVGAPVVRYPKYHIKFNEYARKFKSAKGDVLSLKQDIESRLKTELVVGKVAKMEVQKCQRDVEEIIIQDSNKQGCLSRSCQAKDLDEKTQQLKEMYGKGVEISKAESLVIDDHSRKGVVLSAPELHAREGTKAKILKYLMEDKFTRIGVCGIGGSGKTTIMKNVHNELLSMKGGKFKKIAFVTVSKAFDVIKLQKGIASQIQNGNFPDDMDAETRAGVLLEMLSRGSYLLILDDVWEPLPLDDIGIPDYDGETGCKLVLTTRFRNVARRMNCKEVSLELLSKSEALQLFLSKVGNGVMSTQGEIKKELQPFLSQVVNECGGLPLAIVTVATTMRNETSPSMWEIALIELKERKKNVASSRIVDGATKDGFEILKFSYDRLGDLRVQSCFLYCAMYPEDFAIPKGKLIEYWIVEGFIDVMKTRHEMRCKGHPILKQLEENCLLENVETSYSRIIGNDEDKEAVKMHDLLRNLALDIASRDHQILGKAGMKMKKLPDREEWKEDLQKVSLMMNTIEEVPRDLSSPKCETLTTLLLSHNSLVTIPESFFKGIHQLRILDLSHNHEMEGLPNSVSNLVNLTTLLLHSCKLLKKVPSLSNCLALTKLDLCKSGIDELPEGMEMLIKLKFLELSHTKIKKLPEGILLKFSCLEILGLYIQGVMVKAEELCKLKKLEFFSGCLRDLDELSYCTKLIQSERNWLRDYSITVGEASDQMNVGGKREICFFNLSISTGNHFQLPLNLESVNINNCKDFKYLRQLCFLNEAINLNKLVVYSWECLEFAFSCPASFFNFKPFQNLNHLLLFNLDNLESLFEEEEEALASSVPAHSSFPLKTLAIEKCPKIKKILSPWLLLGFFQNLESIGVGYCEELEEIIMAPKVKIQVEELAVKLPLPKLKTLALTNLPKLKSICGTNTTLVCDSLEIFGIEDCTMLTRVPLYLPQLDNNNSQPSPPPSLKDIKVSLAEWWEALEWDHPNAAQVLSPLVEFG